MLIPRRLTEYLKELTNYFPAISLTGPRQAGKTTLLKQLYSDYTYLSLEDIELRAEAEAEPRDFLKKYNDKIIFDEAQRFPQLFSYLQQVIDDDRRNTGRFILSGSQNFLLRKNITQSLAGRVGIAKLMPLDNHELKQVDLLPDNFELACLLGGYPGKIDMGLKGRSFYRSYLSSYIERDVAELISVSNLTVFQRFLRVCATMAGRIINVDKLSRQVGVSPSSISSWLGILEQSYIIFRLPPFFRNLGKRLTKTPKLYFYDTGLLCYLLNLYDVEDIQRSGFKGEIFENF
ncbi:MAG: ATP-binding protein, partial [Bacteroidota bacterium]